jgi:hypothetical protein
MCTKNASCSSFKRRPRALGQSLPRPFRPHPTSLCTVNQSKSSCRTCKMKKANCLRSLESPPPSVEQIVAKYSGHDHGLSKHCRGVAATHDHSDMEPNSLAQQLAPEDYCAAHLASIAESVVSHLTRPMGRVVNYRDLPGACYHDIFPRLLGYPLSHRQLTDMQHVATLFQESQQWPPSQTKCRAGWENLSSRFGAQGTAGQP